jgi:hypothetical protein
MTAMPATPRPAPVKQIVIHSVLPPRASVERSASRTKPSTSQLTVPATANGTIGGSGALSRRSGLRADGEPGEGSGGSVTTARLRLVVAVLVGGLVTGHPSGEVPVGRGMPKCEVRYPKALITLASGLS